jgi:branched-chain amino acid transport system substrate-binding protein
MAPAATLKNQFLTGLGALVVLSLAACQPSAPATAPTTAPAPTAVAAPAAPATSSGKPLKIGVLLSTTGPFVFEGTGGIEALKMYLEQEKNQLGGRPVQVVYEDTEGRPDQALTKAKKLVEQDQVDLLIGPVGSNEGLAIRDYVDAQKIPTFFGYAIAKDLTQDKASPYVFRTGGSLQLSAGGGWMAAKKLGFKRAIVVSADYAAGHDAADMFKKYFESSGGKVVDEIFPPLGATDVAPYITRVQSELDSADVVVLPQIVGETAIQFVKNYDQFGLKAQKPLFVSGVSVDDASTLQPAGDAAIGVQSYAEWAALLDLPANKAFVGDFKTRYNKDPGQHHFYGYIMSKVIGEGLKAVNGNTENKAALIAALEKVQFDGPGGPFKFDDKHQVIITEYLRVVEKQGSLLVNTVKDKVENVSQFWQAPN